MRTDCDGCPACAGLRAELAAKQQEVWDLTESLSRNDALTGALNRRGMTELVAEELHRSSRTGQPFCFAVIGIDHMKSINAISHEVGDQVLQAVSREAKASLRTIDRFSRFEGDEFGVLLPATWLHQGLLAMSRLKELVAEQNWDFVAPGHGIAFSTGLTTNAPAERAEQMILRAQNALAQAKAEGRNRVVTLEEELPAGLFAAMDD